MGLPLATALIFLGIFIALRPPCNPAARDKSRQTPSYSSFRDSILRPFISHTYIHPYYTPTTTTTTTTIPLADVTVSHDTQYRIILRRYSGLRAPSSSTSSWAMSQAGPMRALPCISEISIAVRCVSSLPPPQPAVPRHLTRLIHAEC